MSAIRGLLVIGLAICGGASLIASPAPQLPPCNGTVAEDPADFCGGLVQDSCGRHGVVSCEGVKYERFRLPDECESYGVPLTLCKNSTGTGLCYRELYCLWDSGSQYCVTFAMVDYEAVPKTNVACNPYPEQQPPSGAGS
jgi:hypothetical protein